MPRDCRGRDQRDAVASRGALRTDSQPQTLEGARVKSTESPREPGPADTLSQASSLRKGDGAFLLLQATPTLALCYGSPRKLTSVCKGYIFNPNVYGCHADESVSR